MATAPNQPQLNANQLYSQSLIRQFAHLIPVGMVGGIERYVLWGIPTGSFLQALLENDFMGAATRADDENQRAFFGWATFLYNAVPIGCRGSRANVQAWLIKGGLADHDQRAEQADAVEHHQA